MKKLVPFLLLGATILGFSACEKKGKGKWQILLATADLQGATATLSKTTDVAFADEVILTVTPNENAIWQTPPTATATNASLKNKTTEGNVYSFVFTGFENNTVVTVTGVANVPCVDLGLSVMWATCNVGATQPEEYGDYFAWGETEPKSTYNWTTYKYGSASDKLTKYCTDSNYGIVDNKTTLDLADDAARAHWGGTWRMPTKVEQDELRTQCTWTWTTRNGVNGHEVKGKNGNSIFLPAAGCRLDSDLDGIGVNGFFGSSSLGSGYSFSTLSLYFEQNSQNLIHVDRCLGQSVRAVCPK